MHDADADESNHHGDDPPTSALAIGRKPRTRSMRAKEASVAARNVERAVAALPPASPIASKAHPGTNAAGMETRGTNSNTNDPRSDHRAANAGTKRSAPSTNRCTTVAETVRASIRTTGLEAPTKSRPRTRPSPKLWSARKAAVAHTMRAGSVGMRGPSNRNHPRSPPRANPVKRNDAAPKESFPANMKGLPSRTNAIAWESTRKAMTPANPPHTTSRCASSHARNEYRRMDASGIAPNPAARTARSVMENHFERFTARTARTW